MVKQPTTAVLAVPVAPQTLEGWCQLLEAVVVEPAGILPALQAQAEREAEATSTLLEEKAAMAETVKSPLSPVLTVVAEEAVVVSVVAAEEPEWAEEPEVHTAVVRELFTGAVEEPEWVVGVEVEDMRKKYSSRARFRLHTRSQ